MTKTTLKTPLQGQSGHISPLGSPANSFAQLERTRFADEIAMERNPETVEKLTLSRLQLHSPGAHTPVNTPGRRPEQQEQRASHSISLGSESGAQPLPPSGSLSGSVHPLWLRELRSLWRGGGLSSLRGAVPLLGPSTSKVRPLRSQRPPARGQADPFSNEGALSHRPCKASFSCTSPPVVEGAGLPLSM